MPKSLVEDQWYGTGRRKEAIARVYIKKGAGVITVNGKEFTAYFTRELHQRSIVEVLTATNVAGQYDVKAFIKGGGMTGQAGALRHGLARALVALDEENRPTLRKLGSLTRDPRMKERKKYGRKGARKRFQFSKR